MRAAIRAMPDGVYEFTDFTVSWEHRQFAGNNAEKGESVGCYFYGTEGTFHLGWQKGWTFYPANASQPVVHEEPQLHEPDQQNIKELWADFLQAIRTGTRPVSDIEEVQRSTNVSLLAMLAPIVMGALGAAKRSGGLDAGGLAAMLGVDELRAHPVGRAERGVFLKEVLAFDAVGITLE